MGDKLDTFSVSPILRPKNTQSQPKRQRLDAEAIHQRKVIAKSRLEQVSKMAHVPPEELENAENELNFNEASTPTNNLKLLNLNRLENQENLSSYSVSINSSPTNSSQSVEIDKKYIWSGPEYIEKIKLSENSEKTLKSMKSEQKSRILSQYPTIISNLKQAADVIINDDIKYMNDDREFAQTVFDKLFIKMFEKIDDEWHNLNY